MRGNPEKTFWSVLRGLLLRRRPQDGDEAYVKRAFWPKVKRAGAKIPFVKEAVAMYFCALDPETPLKAKGIAFAALAYFILPFDAIPDAIAAVGFADDAAVVAAALLALGSRITKDHLTKAEEWLNSP